MMTAADMAPIKAEEAIRMWSERVAVFLKEERRNDKNWGWDTGV